MRHKNESAKIINDFLREMHRLGVKKSEQYRVTVGLNFSRRRETLNKIANAVEQCLRRFVIPLPQKHSLQPAPSPLCGLASWPLLGACFMYSGE